MLCYRDMTFCTFYKKCKNGKTCVRSLKQKIQKSADEWWGKGEGQAPICVFSNKPKCFEDK